MPGRRVFFSFHYEQAIWRASNVRNTGKVDATAAAGWDDASLWEEAKQKGDSAIKRLIDDGLNGNSVTAVLIGAETARRPWVTYEIEKSIERGNGLLGVRIHNIKDQGGFRSRRGKVPGALSTGNYRIYDWNRASFGRCVEHAALDAGGNCLSHDRKQCFICRWLWWW
jgi:MTH538 TIR-like domain (DUF1863)